MTHRISLVSRFRNLARPNPKLSPCMSFSSPDIRSTAQIARRRDFLGVARRCSKQIDGIERSDARHRGRRQRRRYSISRGLCRSRHKHGRLSCPSRKCVHQRVGRSCWRQLGCAIQKANGETGRASKAGEPRTSATARRQQENADLASGQRTTASGSTPSNFSPEQDRLKRRCLLLFQERM
jgi:hypothetical protein